MDVSSEPVAVGEAEPPAPASLADDPRMRFMPESPQLIARFDMAHLRTTSFSHELLDRFAATGLERDEVLATVIADIDDIVVGGGERTGLVIVLSGDLAPKVDAIATVLETEREMTREDRDGRVSLSDGSRTFVVVDERTWVFTLGLSEGPDLERASAPASLSQRFPDFARNVASAGAGQRALVELFMSGDDSSFRDLELMLRFGCASCDDGVVFDAVVGYPDAERARHHADQLSSTIRGLSEGSEADVDLGLEAEGSWVRVREADVDVHQIIGNAPMAFHDTLALLFVLSTSMHPPNMGL